MRPANLVLGAIVFQAIAGLSLGLPGHLSPDSIMQLYEARTLNFISFHPPLMSLLLRVMDAWIPGTGLFVVLDQILLTASFALLYAERRSELRWSAAVAAALVVLNPLLIAYTGIVWKDVLMSHLTVLGYVCLYVAARRPPSRRRTALALLAVLALALAASLRQHALVLAITGAVFAAYVLASGRAARWGIAIALSIVIVCFNVAIIAYADAVAVGEKIARTEIGLRSLANFDLAGIAANGGAIPDAAVSSQVHMEMVPSYSPLNHVTLPAAEKNSALWRLETPVLLALWGRSIWSSPGAYLQHRAAHFSALLRESGTAPLCEAAISGIPPTVYVPGLWRDIMPELGLQGRFDRRDRALAKRLDQLRRTPIFNHVFWSIVLAATAAVLCGGAGGGALAVLAVSAFLFTLGFGVIGISCEFRYLYVLPVAATMLLFILVTRPTAAGVLRPDPNPIGNASRGG